MFKKICILMICFGLFGCQKTREEVDQEQRQNPPQLMCTQDGVRLYRVYDAQDHHWVYFTSPTGDVSWRIVGGEDEPDRHFAISGTKKGR